MSNWLQNEIHSFWCWSPFSQPFSFLLLPLNTLQAEEDWLPGWPRTKLHGGHDKTGQHHVVEESLKSRSQSLEPGRAYSNPNSVTNLDKSFLSSGASVASVNGGRKSSLPSTDVIKIRKTVCEDSGKFLTHRKCSRNTSSLISSLSPVS